MCLRESGCDLEHELLLQDAESPGEDVPLPGFPAGWLAYQLNYRCRKGCTHCSCGASVDGGGRGQAG